MAFVVFEDLVSADNTKIHLDTCRFYLNRDEMASTVAWHGPFKRHAEAVASAERIVAPKSRGFRDASCCMRLANTPSPSHGADGSQGHKRLAQPRTPTKPEVGNDGALTWAVQGQPVAWAGGDPEQLWREALRAQNPAPSDEMLRILGPSRELRITFQVRSDQVLGMPDLDNLMVPVVEELRDMGWFHRGYPSLYRRALRKGHTSACLGVRDQIRPEGEHSDRTYKVSIPGKMRANDVASSEAVEDAVRAYMEEHGLHQLPFGQAVSLLIGYEQTSPTSIVGMLKPTIDGLEPLLGRPASASSRSRFFPADERVVEVTATRVAGNLERVSLGWSAPEY